MKIDVSECIIDLKGKEMTDGSGEKVTLGSVCVNALWIDPHAKNGQDKMKRLELARRITNGEQDYSVDEVKILRDAVSVLRGAILPALVLEKLDG